METTVTPEATQASFQAEKTPPVLKPPSRIRRLGERFLAFLGLNHPDTQKPPEDLLKEESTFKRGNQFSNEWLNGEFPKKQPV